MIWRYLNIIFSHVYTKIIRLFSATFVLTQTQTHTSRHVQSIKDIRIIGLDKQSKLGKQKYAHIYKERGSWYELCVEMERKVDAEGGSSSTHYWLAM